MPARQPHGSRASGKYRHARPLRDYSDAEIETYLRAETPYDCAGSAKAEGLGIALLDAIESDDSTALIGLPLIALSHMLRAAGFSILGAA